MSKFKDFLDYILLTILLILLFFTQNESISKQVYSIFGGLIGIYFFINKLISSKKSNLTILSSIFVSIVISISIIFQFANFEIINVILNILGFLNIISVIYLFFQKQNPNDKQLIILHLFLQLLISATLFG